MFIPATTISLIFLHNFRIFFNRGFKNINNNMGNPRVFPRKNDEIRNPAV